MPSLAEFPANRNDPRSAAAQAPPEAYARPPFVTLREGESPRGFDRVELKYDGMWCGAVVCNGRAVLRARSGNIKLEVDVAGLPACVLAGEYLRGTSWSKPAEHNRRFMVHDLLELRGVSLCPRALRDRRVKLERLFQNPRIPKWIGLVRQHPIRQWRSLWKRQVAGGDWEGLVFKNSAHCYGAPWGRKKRVVTQEYVCMGVNQSESDPEQAASLQGGLFTGGVLRHVVNVGALGNELRAEAWTDPQYFIGRVFEAQGNALFGSGALRHPFFVRFRDDKMPAECVVDA